MTPLWTIGNLQVTPYSLMILLGTLAGTALALRNKQVRPLLPAVVLGALLLGHAVWVLFCPYDLEAYEGKGYMLLHIWEGGYTLYGALLGGALGALVAGKLSGVRWTDALDALAPGACAALFFARVGEFFSGEGVGRQVDVEALQFFPVSLWNDYFEEWRYNVWFWEALVALVLLLLLLKREKRALPGHQTFLFLTVLGTTQILLEQMRRDHYLRLIVFVRLNQLVALATLIAVLVLLLVRTKPGKARLLWCLAALLFASLADMASEFVFDKYEYAPWLYASMPLAVLACGGMLYAWKGKKGILTAAVICVAAAGLLLAYASRAWDEVELSPVEDMLRFLILYGTMAVDMVIIALAIHLNVQRDREIRRIS